MQNKNSEFCAPLTSFDWNETDLKRVGTSSIDTTCTIWDIEREIVDTQLIAHDKEVYDIAWGGVGVFASVSADGSVRVFDLRDKEHSTIIYESPQPDTPLLRLGWNKQDPRYMATILMDSPRVVILDIRFPTLPVAELQRHQACVNATSWAPHSSCHICTAGDDTQALIWDLSSMGHTQDGGLGRSNIGILSRSRDQPATVVLHTARLGRDCVRSEASDSEGVGSSRGPALGDRLCVTLRRQHSASRPVRKLLSFRPRPWKCARSRTPRSRWPCRRPAASGEQRGGRLSSLGLNGSDPL
eukprot:scaffold1626_cov372-Prasinococcus_capsulatus_cf.AAC.23